MSMEKEAYACLFVAILVTAAWVGTIVHFVYIDIWAKNNVNSLLDRAKTAADAHDMKMYLEQLRANMEKYGMTQGYFAFVYKNPNTDMRECYRIVCNLIDRLERVEKLRKDSTEYQLMIMDIRKDLNSLEINAWKWYYINHFSEALAWFVIYIWSWLGLLVVILAWILVLCWW